MTLSTLLGQTAPVDTAALAKYDLNRNGRLDPTELATKAADDARAAQAPVTTATPADAAATGDSVVQMSPFEVNSGDDRGYAASNTLAGTRLNSRIEDIAGSVSVITKEQLIDTAALDINDIFLYEIGTEGTGQFTDLSNDGRGDYDNVAGNPTGANRVRGLSAANIAVDGFAASGSIPIDTYNVGAVEIARGANSSLAGVGEAGGTVNLVQNRANLTRSSTNITARVDSFDGFRASMDLNRPLIANKLSMRFSAVYEEKGYVRKPSLERTDRQTLGFTFRPFRRTTVSGSYERLSQWSQRANAVTPLDTITPWRENGSPTWDWTTRTFTVNGVKGAPVTNFNTSRPNGIVNLGAGVRIMQQIDDGEIHYMARGDNGSIQVHSKSSNVSSQGGLYKQIGTTDQSIYDWTEINLAAPNYEKQDAGIANAKLEQGLIDTRRFRLNSELAWRKEDQEVYMRSFVGQLDGVGGALSVDTSEFLHDGRPNPFLGRPFVGGINPQAFRKLSYSDNFRLQLAASLDLTRERNLFKWLGRHNSNLYGEYRYNVSANSLRLHDTIDAHPYFNPPTNAAGNPRNLNANNDALFYPMYYMGKTNLATTGSGGAEYGNIGTNQSTGTGFFASYPVAAPATNATSVYNIDQPVDIREAFFSAQTVQKKKNRTRGGTIQSFFLRDSIVTTFGQRQDKVYTIRSLGEAPPVNGYTNEYTVFNFGRDKRWREGKTDTKGAVVRPFKELPFVKRAAESGSGLKGFAGQAFQGLGLHYNESQNFSPADTAYNLYLQELPNPAGISKEYGFSLNLFNRKLNMRVTRQETIQEKTRAATGVIASRALSIDFDIPGQTRNFDLYQAVRSWYIGTPTVPGIRPDFTEEQMRAKAAEVMGLTPEFIDEVTGGGRIIADSSDTLSTGTEVEIQFNPSRYWTLRATGGQQRAIETGISVFIQQFMAEREPIWRSITVPTDLRADGTQLPGAGLFWFTDPTLPGDTPEGYFLGNVQQPVNLAVANQGKVKTQGREYTANVTTRYQLAGLFSDHKWLKNVSVGGSMRWASRAVIGYLGDAPDPDGVVRKLDRNKPVHDKATANVDLLLTYTTRLYNNKIRANFQLNVRNATESGRLQGVAVNPDGQFWRYRIIDPRQFIFTTSFDL